MDSEGYLEFTKEEGKKLKELFGRDLFGKGCSGKDLTEDQVQQILTRISPLLRQWLKTKDILPFLKQRYLLTETETLRLESGSLRPQEQAVRLVEFLMNKGSYGIGALYLCLIESSEQLSGLPAHYQLAGDLKQIVQAECGVVSVVASGATGGDDDKQPFHSLHLVMENLHGIAVTPETGKAFADNLGFSEEEFPSIPGDLLSICHLWMDRQSVCYVEKLTEALVRTKGLGRFTTRLCDHRNGASPELCNFFLTLGDKWQDIAKYLGFSAEEIQGIVSPHQDNTEMQVSEFLHLWQLPDCGQRILPLMHQLKSLTGIVEPKNPSRRFDDRPGTLGYMNRHLKTDIAGIPHRSLDTYTHSSPPRPPASGHSFPGGSSFRQPAPLKSPGYQPTYPNPPGYHRSSSHPLSASKSADSSHPRQRLPDDSSSSAPHESPLKSQTSPALPQFTATKPGHSTVVPKPASCQPHPTIQKQSSPHGNEVEPRRVVSPVVQQDLDGNLVFPNWGQGVDTQQQLLGNKVVPHGDPSAILPEQLFGNQVSPSYSDSEQPEAQLFENKAFPREGRDAYPQRQLFGTDDHNTKKPPGQLLGNHMSPDSSHSAQPTQLFGNEVFPSTRKLDMPPQVTPPQVTPPQAQFLGNEVQPSARKQVTSPQAQVFGNEVLPSSSNQDTPSQGQLFGNEVLSGDAGSWRPSLLGNEVDRNSGVVVLESTSGVGEMGLVNHELSQPEDDAQHDNDLSALLPETSNVRPFPPPSSQPLSSSQPMFMNKLTDGQPQSMSSDADSIHAKSETQARNSSSSQPHTQHFVGDQVQESGESGSSSIGAITPSLIPADDFSSQESGEHGDMVERDCESKNNERRNRETCGQDVIRAIEDLDGLEMLNALVESGAKINLPTEEGSYPIHYAVDSGNPEKLLLVLNSNVDVNVTRADGKTALHMACIKQDFQMIQILVERGADVAAQDQEGFTCLHYKESLESIDMVTYLVHNGAPVDIPSKDSYLTPLLVCCFAGDETFEAACHFITRGASVNGSPKGHMKPLITASGEGHVWMVKLLLAKEADANLSDQDGNTALLKACANNHPEVTKQLLEGRPAINVNAANSEGLTPLMAAVTNSNLELVGILVSRGADVNCSRMTKFNLAGSETPMEMTPLSDASARGKLNIVQVLVENGAEMNSISERAISPIAFAVLGGHNNVVEYLLKQNDLDAGLSGLSQPFMQAVKCQDHKCADLLIARYGGIDQLLEDAAQNSMDELVEHVQMYKQLGTPVQQQTKPTPPPPQVTNPEAFTCQQIPQHHLPQQQSFPQKQLPQQQLQQPLLWQPIPVESQTQRSPLNPASQGTLHPLDLLQRPEPRDLKQPQLTYSTSLQANDQHCSTIAQTQMVNRAVTGGAETRGDIAQTQMVNQAVTGGAETSNQEVDKSLFEPRPRSPPHATSPKTQRHPPPLPQLFQTPSLLQDSIVEILHEFAQICISAAVRNRGHEWLIEKAAHTGYDHLLQFFVEYFDSSAEFAKDGKLGTEFIGGDPSPLNFLLSGRYVTKADFESVLEDFGSPGFADELTMALYEFPGNEQLPQTSSGVMDALFNQHFTIGSPFPNPSSLRPPSPPPPQPLHQQSKLSFPETGDAHTHPSKAGSSAPTATSGIPFRSTVEPQTSPKPIRQSRIPVPVRNSVPVKSGSSLSSRSTSTEDLTVARSGGGGSKKLPQSSIPHTQIEKKHASFTKQAAGSEKREASVVAKPLPSTGRNRRMVGFEKLSKTSAQPQLAVTTEATITGPKGLPKKKSSGSSSRKHTTLTFPETALEERLIHPSSHSQESSQYYSVRTDVHEMQKTLEGLTFTHEQVPDPENSELFKVIAPHISKWKILGRYLGLDDDTLDTIHRENHFSIERCYKTLVTWRKRFQAKATYLELAKGLKNTMREDLLPSLVPYMKDGSVCERERIIIPIGENPDLQMVKGKFRLHKDRGMNSARVSLQYPSQVSSQSETLQFVLPSLDESSVKLLEVVCIAANTRENAKHVQLFVQYLDH